MFTDTELAMMLRLNATPDTERYALINEMDAVLARLDAGGDVSDFAHGAEIAEMVRVLTPASDD